MHKTLLGLLLALLLALPLGGSLAPEAKAGAWIAGPVSGGIAYQPLPQPVRVWRDCQRIARCSGCQPVYRCRSCAYQRQCYRRYGPCQWTDVCVWGPYLPVAPRGVPVY